MVSIGIDIGGTSVKGVLYHPVQGFSPVLRRPTVDPQGNNQVLEAVKDLIHQLQKDAPLKGLGVGTPGLVDQNGHLFGDAVNISGWTDIPLKEYLEGVYKVPVQVANDVNFTAYGEWRLGAGQNTDNMVCISLGTGVGSGLVLGGKLFLGASGMAGELGHVVVDEGGRLCNCGLKGCLERYSSATGIHDTARLMAKDFCSPLAEAVRASAEEDFPSAKTVYDYRTKGDPLAEEAHRISCRYLAKAIGHLAQILNPGVIVLGGGVLEAGEVIIEGIQEQLAPYLLPLGKEHIKILRAQLGANAGVYGAALFGWDSPP